MVTVTYKNQRFDVNVDTGRVVLWWSQGNRWGQEIYRFREVKSTDLRYKPVMNLAKGTN